MSEVSILGRVRKLLEAIDRAGPGNNEEASLNEQLALLFANESAPYAEITKVGAAFEVHTVAAAVAVVALPTTANLLSLWNGEAPGDGLVYVIDRVWSLQIASAAAAGQASLIGCLGQTAVAPLATAGLAFNALNGNGGGGPGKTKAINSTAALDAVTGVLGNWRLLPGQKGGVRVGVTSIPGMFNEAEVHGKIIVPPGRLFGVHLLADTVATTALVGIEFHQRKLTLG